MSEKQLEPGRELDALVAEKVMGCTVGSIRMFNGKLYLSCECEDRAHEAQTTYVKRFLARYSTDITAAMTVFMWMAKRGVVRLSNGDGDSYDCDFIPTRWPPDDDLTIGNGFVDKFNWQGTEEEAWAYTTCLAALKAKEKGDGEE